MAENKIVTPSQVLIIGGSAGSLEVLLKVIPMLKTTLPFAIVIVLHRKNSSESSLAGLISSRASLPVFEIEDKQTLLPSTIYIAPADYHVLFEKNGSLSLDYSEKINYSRPSIDVTFESAAEVLGKAASCLLLSGANSDGSAGVRSIKAQQGKVLIQDPDTAESPFMPQQALLHVKPDAILKTDEMAAFINSL